uniref:Uncharacterized protein n=1 Tax=Chrysemys picta bellii TaxID=8478 RepID=A0A8C3H6E0_CHRPI
MSLRGLYQQLCFIDRETETQSGEVTCPRSHRKEVNSIHPQDFQSYNPTILPISTFSHNLLGKDHRVAHLSAALRTIGNAPGSPSAVHK